MVYLYVYTNGSWVITEIDVQPSDTLMDLKMQIEAKLGLSSTEGMTLIHEGNVLEDDSSTIESHRLNFWVFVPSRNSDASSSSTATPGLDRAEEWKRAVERLLEIGFRLTESVPVAMEETAAAPAPQQVAMEETTAAPAPQQVALEETAAAPAPQQASVEDVFTPSLSEWVALEETAAAPDSQQDFIEESRDDEPMQHDEFMFLFEDVEQQQDHQEQEESVDFTPNTTPLDLFAPLAPRQPQSGGPQSSE